MTVRVDELGSKNEMAMQFVELTKKVKLFAT